MTPTIVVLLIYVIEPLSILLFSLRPLAAFEDPEIIIHRKCTADWSDNSNMKAACIEQQREYLNKSLSSPVDETLPIPDHTLLREKCAKNWPDDFRMRAQCEQDQIRGFRKLQTPPPKGVTLKEYSVAVASCAEEWPDDFRFRARCLEERIREILTSHDADPVSELRQ